MPISKIKFCAFTFVLILGLTAGCSNDEMSIRDEQYIRFKINDKMIDLTSGAAYTKGVMTGRSNGDIIDPERIELVYSSALSGQKSLWISFYNVNLIDLFTYDGDKYKYIDKNNFQEIFTPGTRNYLKDDQNKNFPAIGIRYSDANTSHTSYNTSEFEFTLDQTGSYFEILSSKDVNLADFKGILVKGKFNCKLALPTGEIIELTDGEFSLSYTDFH